MLKSRAFASALVVGSIAVASVFAAAPANAATLPNGQKITIIESAAWQFYEASPADASLTPVGAQAPGIPYVTGVDVNDDGHGFAVTTEFDEAPFAAWIFSADANTGVLSGGVQVAINFGDVVPDADACTAIDYTDGVVYAACSIFDDDFEATYVGPIDPVTGVLQPAIELNGSSEAFPYLNLTAIAVDPISGQLYGFSYEFGEIIFTDAWLLSEDTGATFVTELDLPAWGADFDRGGQLWVNTWAVLGTSEAPIFDPALATLSLADGSNPFLQQYSLGGVPLTVESFEAITVWGEETLAQTGVTQPPAVWLGATVFLLFGAILAAGAMAVRRRSVQV